MNEPRHKKADFCLCENKGADQLRSNCEADQRLCFRYTDSTLSLLIKSEISSFYAASGTVHVGLCQTWSENPEDRFSRVAAQILNFEMMYNVSSMAKKINVLHRCKLCKVYVEISDDFHK